MKNNVIHLWCKNDIANIIGCETRILKDLISPETKTAINWTERSAENQKTKIYRLNDVFLILKDIYPFISDQERLKILLPKPL